VIYVSKSLVCFVCVCLVCVLLTDLYSLCVHVVLFLLLVTWLYTQHINKQSNYCCFSDLFIMNIKIYIVYILVCSYRAVIGFFYVLM